MYQMINIFKCQNLSQAPTPAPKFDAAKEHNHKALHPHPIDDLAK